VRLGHAHAGGKEFIERVDFGIFPGRFLLLAPEARALGDGARLAAATHLAALVLRTLLEAALRHIPITPSRSAGALRSAPDTHGLFAALERADDLVDHPIIDQGLQGGARLHESLCASSGNCRVGALSDP
jgi:hypothetical protein